MSGCCSPDQTSQGASAFFSRRSNRYAKQFRKGGLERAQKYLLDGIKQESIQGSTILDIGCGVGQLHLTLLREGAARSVGVDLSEAMLRQAQGFAEEYGLEERVRYLTGDFTQISSSIPESDITVLDKVVCCYEDLTQLLHASTGKTKHIYALSHPKENLIMEGVFKGQALLGSIFRWGFRPFWHNWSEMKSLILSQGFQLLYENSTIAWQVLVFRRM
jgi:2-polyprenyl-3-methyl-5-hydroxy-6-metoxy-1,4-benzoquinol methylase